MRVLLAEDEVALLRNALNELSHGIRLDDAEFRLRTGSTRDEARALLDRLQLVLADLAGGAASATASPGGKRPPG